MPDEIPPPVDRKSPKNLHATSQNTFGVVYANDLANREIKKNLPRFPVGAILIREKHTTEKLGTPDLVIAMVKREKGFSKKTDDWEFLTISPDAGVITKRETKGDCAKCHIEAKATDWVYRDYLKIKPKP